MNHAPGADRRVSWLSWIVVVAGIVVTVGVWYGLTVVERRTFEARLHLEATKREDQIRDRLHSALMVVRSLAAHFAASDVVSREQFRVFTAPLLVAHPYLRGLSWNPRITAADRAGFEATARAAGLPDYTIRERGPAGELVVAGRRPDHYVVHYIEPMESNRNAIGYDVGSEPDRRIAFDLARDTGDLALTGRIHLVQDPEGLYGFLAVVPFYGPGAPASSPLVRRANLEGFLAGVFRIVDIVQSALSHLPRDDFDLFIIDEAAPPEERLLYAGPSSRRGYPAAAALAGTPEAAPRAHIASLLDLGGRRWQLIATPTPRFIAHERAWAPLWSLVAGLTMTALLGALVRSMAGRAARVERLVRARTAELALVNEALGREVAERRRAEQALLAYRGHLETLVAERTADLRREISQRGLAEEALAASEERLRLTLDAVSGGGWDWNVAAGSAFFSDSWIASLGFDREAVVMRWSFWEDQVHPDDRAGTADAIAQHLAGKTDRLECENRLRTGSGEFRWNLVRGRVVARDAEGRPLRVVGTDADISQRRQAEEQRRQLERQMQHAQKLEGLAVLAGGIAHDFNNLLMIILGSADLARMAMPPEVPGRRELDRIRAATNRAADLTRQLLAYAGRGKYVTEKLDLSRVVREVAALLEASISKSAEIGYDLAPDLPAVEGDVTQLGQVVMNLVTNASEALESKPGRIVVRTGVMDADRAYLLETALDGEMPAGGYVFLEVADTGKGMDEATRARIFDPFFSTKFQGRGLGMAAVHGIVRGHLGAIRVTSREGEGTTVRVLLPSVEGPARSAAGARARSLSGWRGSGTVLVVDDEAAVRDVLGLILGKLGFDVLPASDGEEALTLFRANAARVRAVILDLTMPGFSGTETLRGLREIRADVPVILCSGYSEEESVKAFSEGDLSGFLHKPYQPGDLARLMREALRE